MTTEITGPYVTVSDESGRVILTAAEAREAARQMLAAADEIDASADILQLPQMGHLTTLGLSCTGG